MKEKIKFIKELAKSINSNQLDGIEYENENEKFKISLKKKRKEKKMRLDSRRFGSKSNRIDIGIRPDKIPCRTSMIDEWDFIYLFSSFSNAFIRVG